MFKKNTAGQFIHFQGVDASTGGIKSGVSWTVRRCIDGTFAAATGTASEDGTTGWYKFALSQADTNGNNIAFNFTGTGAVPQTVNILTDGAAPDVNITKIGGTTQTARDLGASVLLSPGTGTGELDITSGVVKANLVQILATALTETAGQIAAAFKQFFDVASPTGTMKAITNVVTTTNLTNAPTAGDLTAAMKASVNAEMVDTLNVDTYAEPGQEAPPATTTLVKKIGHLYKAFRNKITQTTSQLSIYNDTGSTIDQKASVSDSGGTLSRDEIVSGP
jgi:mRNA-degrading endonuclease toxin of MazEF toxin-antitoxin module